MEQEIVQRKDIRFRGIHAAGLHGVGLRSLPGNIVQLARGFFEARGILQEFKPDVMLFTGGYVAAPVALAGWGVPSVLYVPDIEPGLALKTLARLADAIALTTPLTKKFFSAKKRVEVTGYPVRSDLERWTEEEAHQALDLTPGELVLLVFGGSKGARSINRALLDALPELLESTQVVHISGQRDWPEVQRVLDDLPPGAQERYRAFPYLHERMGAAYMTADLVVSRAGASVLGEFPRFGLPALLVPYPHAWRYQRVNARYMSDRGAAEILEDHELPEELLTRVQALLRDERKRERMQESMRALARPQAARSIAELLQEASRKKGARE